MASNQPGPETSFLRFRHASGEAEAFIAPRDGLSHVSGDRSVALLDKTIPQLLFDTVRRNGPSDAAVFLGQNKRFTWDELGETVDAFAAGLLALGLEKGDRIGIWSPNRWEWLVTQFATARAGLILVNINPAYRLAELEYALNKVECRALVTAAQFRSSDYLGMLRTLAPELEAAQPGKLAAARLPSLEIVIRMGEDSTPGMLNFDDVLAMAGLDDHERLDTIELHPGEAINIQFTSGTTGAPKGATLSHINIVNNGNFVTSAIKLTADDRLCIPVPLYHCFGMSMGTMGCVSKGATMVFPGEGFDAGATLKTVAEERCTGLYGVPTMFVAMLDHADFASFDLASLRTGIMAGSPCPIEVMKKVVSLMHMSKVTIAYGMTETSPVSFQSNVDDPLEKRVSTVGRIQPHVEAKVIGAEGETVPVGRAGELCTRGYSVMKGYWEDEEKTAEAIDPEGWMHTGDLATLDAEGYCNIVGRVKDMVIRGGENIYPREIEEFLYRHPKIKEVQVFGVPDARYGEELAAWIVTVPGQTLTEDDIKAFCANQIAHYKVPRYVRFKDSLPMTVTGKPQKFIMREAMMQELGLTDIKTA
ncbi:AMP-binding protein [Mesorhizobium sp. SP-1A]|uniref:AMP-binding protein n=1 Tax=Mesorhizobium sp. SP-1A TaxID=3077840 RepID=UPI0028F71EE6|nr:AMP-binding protein [Mesorhizobium sp. SP-1A]